MLCSYNVNVCKVPYIVAPTHAENMKPLHERLAELRESVKLTRQAFATRIGIDQSTYSRYELGQTKPSLDTLEKISLTFPAIDARWLLTGTGEMKVKSQPADPVSASPLAVVADNEEVKELKEQIRELREHNRLLTELLKSDIDLSEIKKVLSFNPGEHSAAKSKQATMWAIHGDAEDMAA